METRDLRAKYRAVDLWSLVAVGRLSVCAHATPLALHSRYYSVLSCLSFVDGGGRTAGGRAGGKRYVEVSLRLTRLCKLSPPPAPSEFAIKIQSQIEG